MLFLSKHLLVKALFVLKVFKRLPWRFTLVGKRLVKKTRLISKFMTLQTDKQLHYTFPSISRSTFMAISQWNLVKYFSFFSKNHAESDAWKLGSDRSLFLKTYKVKSSCEHIFQEWKELLTWNNQFASFLKGFHWSK